MSTCDGAAQEAQEAVHYEHPSSGGPHGRPILSPAVLLRSIDWAVLREQKDYCLNEAANNSDAWHLYEGIVNLFDALQDTAVAASLAPECAVFGGAP